MESQNNFEIENIANNTRNLSIISHVDHGKTTLSDHLIASGGMMPSHLAGSLRALDFLPEEQRRGITIETSLATFLIEYDNQNYRVNLIDTPGHVDFSGKVAESLRLVDGGLILVDAVEGIMAQTRTVLRQAIREKLFLVLFINKIDRLITELELPLHSIQQRIERIIGEIRGICKELGFEKKYLPSFLKGTILIGSAIDGWAIDQHFVKENKKLSSIIDIYHQKELSSFPKYISLSQALKRCIANAFPSPIEGQKRKFSSLLSTGISNEIYKELLACDNSKMPVAIVGRLFRLNNNRNTASIVRVVSGTLQRGTKLKSSGTNDLIKIMRIIELRGKSSKDVDHLYAGQIGGIVSSKIILPGDLLIPPDKENIPFHDITYVQDPVVAISIEPNKIQDMHRLEESIELIVQLTPGLEFESNADTGEMLILGVGTLLLDVLATELKSQQFDIDVSEPIILQYEMPRKRVEFYSHKNPKILIQAGKTTDFEKFDDKKISYKDKHLNQLIISCDIDKEEKIGFIEVFKQSMRISPKSNVRIKKFTMVVKSYPFNKKLSSYEMGMISSSSVIREALEFTKSVAHEPYYAIEINSVELYLGNILHELQRFHSTIENVTTDGECKINAIIPVKYSLKLADILRQVTDGNVFWSFPSVHFKPVIFSK